MYIINENVMKTISILNDFAEYPGLRHCTISDKSGEEFYHKILNKEFKQAFDDGEKLNIDLDATGGYASSFLDEAFGNLVFDFTLDKVKNIVEIKSLDEPEWKDMIQNQTFKQWEVRRKKGENPKVTIKHPSWYRLVGSKIESDVWEQPT